MLARIAVVALVLAILVGAGVGGAAMGGAYEPWSLLWVYGMVSYGIGFTVLLAPFVLLFVVLPIISVIYWVWTGRGL